MPVPRIVNALLGLWLFASAFLWPHDMVGWWAATLGGTLLTTVAFAGGTFPGARYLNAVIAAMIFSFSVSRSRADLGTRRHDAIIAVLSFVVALVPGFARDDEEHPRGARTA